jgi:GDP-L-fucose synthase
MPTNSYGPNDNYDPQSSHVFPALIKKFADACENNDPQVRLWGTGSPTREFVCSLDVASAAIFLMNNYSGNDIFNIGTGREISIKDLAGLIARETGFKGNLVFDASRPDGTPRKVCDISKITKLGWSPGISLKEGIKMAVAWYREENKITGRK